MKRKSHSIHRRLKTSVKEIYKHVHERVAKNCPLMKLPLCSFWVLVDGHFKIGLKAFYDVFLFFSRLGKIPNFLESRGLKKWAFRSRRKCCAINFRLTTGFFSPMKWKCGPKNRPQKNIYALAIVLYTPLTALMKLSQPYSSSQLGAVLPIFFHFLSPGFSKKQKKNLWVVLLCVRMSVCFIISIIKLLIHSERVAELCTATLWPFFLIFPPFFSCYIFFLFIYLKNKGIPEWPQGIFSFSF